MKVAIGSIPTAQNPYGTDRTFEGVGMVEFLHGSTGPSKLEGTLLCVNPGAVMYVFIQPEDGDVDAVQQTSEA